MPSSQQVLPEAPWRCASPWPYAATVLILLAYGLFYGRLILASTAVPTFDQAAYMTKTYAIADTLHDHPWRALLPGTWLGQPAANRPPLMMALSAILLGPTASAQAIGLSWMIARLAVLLLALHAVARLVGRSGWLPAAALVVLSARGSLLLYPNMYMMDQSFEAFGLLAFAAVAADLLEPVSPRRSALAALATLLLFLIKPAALVFLLPLYAMVMVRAYRAVRREARPRDAVAKLRAAMTPYAVLGAVLFLLAFSPYGRAVIDQYALGARGYWAQPHHPFQTLGMVALLAPPWLLAALGLALIYRRSHKAQMVTRLPALAGITALWWFVFNAVLTYTLDARVLSAAMPVAIIGALVLVCRSRWATVLVSLLAMTLFVAALASVSGQLPTSLASTANMLSPMPPSQQPVGEVGLLPAAAQIRATVGAHANGELRSTRVMIVTSDDFVELAALNVAMRYTGSTSDLHLDSHPWGPDFNMPSFLSFEWFLTKRTRNATPLQGDVWVGLHALDALINDPASPLHNSFEAQWSLPIHQPQIDSPPEPALDDTITLWRLREIPSPELQLRTLRYIAPFFAHTTGEAEIQQQIQALDAATPRSAGN